MAAPKGAVNFDQQIGLQRTQRHKFHSVQRDIQSPAPVAVSLGPAGEVTELLAPGDAGDSTLLLF